MSFLNEQSAFPSGTDESFVEVMDHSLAGALYITDRPSGITSSCCHNLAGLSGPTAPCHPVFLVASTLPHPTVAPPKPNNLCPTVQAIHATSLCARAPPGTRSIHDIHQRTLCYMATWPTVSVVCHVFYMGGLPCQTTMADMHERCGSRFTIKHFASDVTYSADGFLSKNKAAPLHQQPSLYIMLPIPIYSVAHPYMCSVGIFYF